MGYFLSLDLGQSKDFSALTVLEVVPAPPVQVVNWQTITYDWTLSISGGVTEGIE